MAAKKYVTPTKKFFNGFTFFLLKTDGKTTKMLAGLLYK
jgi:hypothetical protein